MSERLLPTRVSNACDRCRRQKQRCDNFRPCTNCVKTKRECLRLQSPSSPSRSDSHRQKRARVVVEECSSPFQHPSNGSARRSRSPRAEARANEREASLERSQTAAARQSQGEAWSNKSIMAEFGDSSSAMDITRRVLRHRASDHTTERATYAIPGGDLNVHQSVQGKYYSIRDLIGIDLPDKSTCDMLINVYFFTVHWFSLVVHETTFRQRYDAVVESGQARASDRPFLLLLLMVLSLGCQYASSFSEAATYQSLDLNNTRTQYLKLVRAHFMDLLDEDSLEFVQICTLLGSYWLYWGKPRSAFSILGACSRSAQAIDLHRQSVRRMVQHSKHVLEERKRVWWTIYTWDRFATIVYGRPLGINDKDCDVQKPAVFTEHLIDIETSHSADLELSCYQTQLNHMYQIVSPFLENIYGIRSGDKPLSDLADTAKQIDKSLQAWNFNLPEKMNIESYTDLRRHCSLETKIHGLQALALHLTFQNLMIVIHRPLLADWTQRRGRESRAQSVAGNLHQHQTSSRVAEHEVYERSFLRCMKAALAISRLEQSLPNLLQLAGKTHLVSFLGMNLFTSSVVLFICALSDVLSDTAQEATRGISRNLKVLKSLSHAGSLSTQCSAIVEDLTQMIAEKENEQALVASVNAKETHSTVSGAVRPNASLVKAVRSTSQNDSDLIGPTAQSAPGMTQPPSPWTLDGLSTSMGQTMESLHKVFKDASHSRPPRGANSDHQANSISDAGPQQIWESAWTAPVSYDARDFPANDLQSQDMGQFWLWELGSYDDHTSNWGINDYHF